MKGIVSGIRKNIGTIIAGFGFLLLCILTFGDIGDILTERYWQEVINNLTSIGFMTVSLMMIQVSVKQGVSEQALQKGLNTSDTTTKYTEHKNVIKSCNERIIYIPYFLQTYNERHTLFKKREFLINNGFVSEELFFELGKKRMKKRYSKIRVYLTLNRIKWATTDIIYNKYGQIITLAEHRSKRLIRGIIMGFIFMIGVTLLAKGLFFDVSDIPLWQRFIKLFTYIITITMTSLFAVTKEYEKGAFGVPNELEELNGIWEEFKRWSIPEYIIKEVKEMEVKDAQTKGNDIGTNIQIEQKEGEDIHYIDTDSQMGIVDISNNICDNSIQSVNEQLIRNI